MGRSLENRIALVTGASRGIGAATARALAREGAFVYVHGNRNAASAEVVVAEIAGSGGSAEVVLADISDPAKIDALFDEVFARRGGLDILVNNAGVFERAALSGSDAALIERTFSVNVVALALATRAFVERTRSEHGRIVNVSSLASRYPGRDASVYAASKAAVDSFTRSWALELGPRGITVNAVSPGLVASDMSLANIPNHERVVRGIALGRLGKPEDVADVVAFLASDAARWLTGQVLGTDGGQIATATLLSEF